jgi:hypothetical protein
MTFVTSQFERRVAASTGTVNGAVKDALREMGFEITTEQLTLIEARRGSQLAMFAMRLRRLPVAVAIRLAQTADGCVLSGSLRDEWNRALLGPPLGLNGPYTRGFGQVQDTIDAHLARVAHTSGVLPAIVESRKPQLGLLERANEAVNRLGDVAVQKGNGVLAGDGLRARRGPWDGVQELCFERGEDEARLRPLDAQAMLTVGGLVAQCPGAMPDNLRAEVERFVARVETAVSELQAQTVIVPVTDGELPVIDFLREQARIRGGLEVRTLRTCTACGQQKIINPDFERLMKRNRRLRQLGGGFGASISSGGIRPFVLVGTILRNTHLDPDFVCPRCQGMEYSESLVTFCPACGDVRGEVVLRRCRKCGHEFKAALGAERFWAARRLPSAGPARLCLEDLEQYVGAPAGWCPDPAGRHEYRYWDGSRWTEHAADAGRRVSDPL